MLVKVKREIISLGDDDVRPEDFTGPSIAPKDFRRWLDDGKEVLVLDTRNDYEVPPALPPCLPPCPLPSLPACLPVLLLPPR